MYFCNIYIYISHGLEDFYVPNYFVAFVGRMWMFSYVLLTRCSHLQTYLHLTKHVSGFQYSWKIFAATVA